ncbi:aminoacyl-histidine dipeptidase [Larsenimonas salina]|uniref:aminoacyl-histidine dipeptidase n=1 Tax=Larsenimonas salina TaxID=1295565 RepID=UPI00207309FE|nr:aminoacyl-histidine dipeptidase [Larsenimonas salina]MCM5704083.1 aminoacyl-histidine dipeptidase [Larsenimonas salina]
MNDHLDTLAPEPLWRHFRTLCNTPRPSGREQAILKKITDWADARGLEYEFDETGNLLIRKAATPGHEDAPGVVLQSHVDMVSQADSDIDHDFERDPIETFVEGGWLHARGTTLGADNGVGAAAALAILEDDALTHGPLEALFTIEEEASLVGARHLAPNWLRGEYLLNLDSEFRGEVYIGCAGGNDVKVDHDFKQVEVESNQQVLEVSVSGLVGGHSGMDIDKGRANANVLLASALWALRDTGVQLVSWSGGTMRNAITRDASATIVVPAEAETLVGETLRAFEQRERGLYQGIDDGLRIEVTQAATPARQALSQDDSRRLLAVLAAMPYGIDRMSVAVPGVAESSNNIGVLRLEHGHLHLGAMVRALNLDSAEALNERFRALFSLIDVEAIAGEGYPGWAPNAQSPLLARFIELHEREVGAPAEVKVIHAGLECGIIGAKYPGLDMISFGPTILGAHSPTERVELEAVEEFYRLLQAMIEELA